MCCFLTFLGEMLMLTSIFGLLWGLTIVVHYVGSAALLFGVGVVKYNLPLWRLLLIGAVIWIILGLLFNGCPFTYVEQYFAYKAWGTEQTYCFNDSLLYKFIFKYF